MKQKYNCFLQWGPQKKNVIQRYMKKSIKRVLNTKKYSDESSVKKHIEKKHIEQLYIKSQSLLCTMKTPEALFGKIMKIIEFFTTFTLKIAIKDIKITIFWLKHDFLPMSVY